jgi:hypothetical protein
MPRSAQPIAAPLTLSAFYVGHFIYAAQSPAQAQALANEGIGLDDRFSMAEVRPVTARELESGCVVGDQVLTLGDVLAAVASPGRMAGGD